jgi:hypothetical protein
MNAEPVRVVRLVVDADGSSSFLDTEIVMTSRQVAPPAAPLDVSDAMPASRVIYWRAPARWDGQQHPAPTRQWVLVLRGAIEIEASDGTTRLLGPGDGALLEDVAGAGHTTRVVGQKPAFGMFVQVPDE